MSLLAQHGYGKGNKIYKGLENQDISGIIFSPKADELCKIEEYSKKIKEKYPSTKIYFDPQFYLCTIQGDVSLGKFPSYDYCKLDTNRSLLSNYSFLKNICASVFDIQAELGVSSYLSPTVIFNDFEDNDSQIALNLANLFNEIENKNCYISFCINESAFNNIEKINSFLDTISLFNTRGFYIVIDRNNNNGKINEINPNILARIMMFIHSLSVFNEFDVIVGYSDLLSIPLAAVSNADFATGWFSNLKRFSVSNFRKLSGGHRPKKRYTSGVLMNSLLLMPEFQALIELGLTDIVITDSPYNDILKYKVEDTKWTDEISCLHNWHVINQLIEKIQSLENINDRLKCLEGLIKNAEEAYKIIGKQKMPLDYSSRDKHLSMWTDAIQIFREGMVSF